MANYNLAPNESILIQSSGVLRESGKLMTAFTDELILTNMNIIHVSKGMFGNTKGIQKFPLNQVKVIDREAQALLGKSSNGMPNLQIYFINGQVSFQFQSSSKKEIMKWVNEISKVLTGHDSSRNSEQNQFAIPGATFVAETLKDTIGVFKGTFGIKSNNNDANERERVSKKCIGCMAAVSGVKGQSFRCRYCDTDQVL